MAINRGTNLLARLVHHDVPSMGRRLHDDRRSRRQQLSGQIDEAVLDSDSHLSGLLSGSFDRSVFRNPVLTARDVTDYGDVTYVADPFLTVREDAWHLFFEVFNPRRNPSAVIGRASSHDAGQSWHYDGVVLDAGVHSSFPYVFTHDGVTWMTPNLDQPEDSGSVPLYRSTDRGETFHHVSTIASPKGTPTDRVLFYWSGRWWLFVSVVNGDRGLHIYSASQLTEQDWSPHPKNPLLVNQPRIPGGRPIVAGNRLILFFQDGPHHYGEEVRTFEVVTLSQEDYRDEPVSNTPIIGPTDASIGWDSGRMHTFDPRCVGDCWICAVDGDVAFGNSIFGPNWSIGLLVAPV